MNILYWLKRPFVLFFSRRQKDIIRKKFYELIYGLDVGLGSKIKSPKGITASTEIGRYTTIGKNSKIHGSHKVEIGDFCSIAEEVRFQSTNHDSTRLSVNYRLNEIYPDTGTPVKKNGGIKVGNDVWIGSRAIILPDVEIGDGAIIGAGAVVTKDVEDFEIVGGVPAENIGYRFNEAIRNHIKNIYWWNEDVASLKSKKELFEKSIKSKKDLQN